MVARIRSNAFALAISVGVLLLFGGASALATTDSDTSEPTGRLTAGASLQSTTDKDGDGNPDTATRGDTVTAAYSVTNNTSEQQSVTLTINVDGPGTANDATFSEVVALGPDETYSDSLTYKVTGRFEKGLYRATASATDGVETASATAELTVQ